MLITVYLIRKAISGGDITGTGNAPDESIPGTTIENNVITVRMAPITETEDAETVIRMIPVTTEDTEDGMHYEFFEAVQNEIGTGVVDISGTEYEEIVDGEVVIRNTEPGSGSFEWFRGVSEIGDRQDFITVYMVLPKDTAHTKNVILQGKRLENIEYSNYSPSTLPGEIPLSGNKNEYISASKKLRTAVIFTDPGTYMIPGETLQLLWKIQSGSTQRQSILSEVLFDTPAITGGVIKAVSNQYTETEYHVSVNNQNLLLKPTDFAEYSVGEWVYVLKQDDDSAKETERTDKYGRVGVFNNRKNVKFNAILNLINTERALAGVHVLQINGELSSSALSHASWMAGNRVDPVTHIGYNDSTVFERADASGYFNDIDIEEDEWFIGENIARGNYSAQALIEYWKNETEYSNNLFSSDFIDFGLGIAYTDSVISVPYFVLVFGKKDDSVVVADAWRVLPIRANEYGNPSDNYETREYALNTAEGFRSLFEISQHIGIITEVHEEDDTADILIEGLGIETFTDVSIFYHCQDSSTTTGGASAFSVDDEVVVLNEGGKTYPNSQDLIIVGFKDSLKLCGFTVAMIQLGNEYILWDLKKNALFPLLDSEGNEKQPLSLVEMWDELEVFGLEQVKKLSSSLCDTYANVIEVPEVTQCDPTTEDACTSWETIDRPDDCLFGSEWGGTQEFCTAGYCETEHGFGEYSAEFLGWVDEDSPEFDGTNRCDLLSVQRRHTLFQNTNSESGSVTLNDTDTVLSWEGSILNFYEFYTGDADYHAEHLSEHYHEYDLDLPGDDEITGASLSEDGLSKRKACLFTKQNHSVFVWSSSDESRDQRAFVTEALSYISTIDPLRSEAGVIGYDEISYGGLGTALQETPPKQLYYTISPTKAGLYKQFAVVLEQPVAVIRNEAGEVEEHWGFSQLYVSKLGVLSDPENPEDGHVYEWKDLVPVDMENLFSYFTRTLDEDIVINDWRGGLKITLYSNT